MSLEQLIDEAFRLALESAKESVGPTALVLSVSPTGARNLTRLIGHENDQAALEAGRARVRSSGPNAYAIAVDAFLRDSSDQRFDAIIIEAAELGATEARVIAQRYRSDPFELIGDRVDLGVEANVLSG